MQVRDGPAAVRGDALHAEATGLRAGKAAREGAPSQKTCRLAATRTPRGRRIRVSTSPSSLVAGRVGSLSSLAGSAAAASVHVRVEGKTQTIFGSDPAARRPRANALDALEAASRAGEFYYHVTRPRSAPTSTRSAATRPAAQSGWVFKVNGVSPPVGADQVELEGRRHRALVLRAVRRRRRAADARCSRARRRSCYRVDAQDDNGQARRRARRVAPRRRPLA